MNSTNLSGFSAVPVRPITGYAGELVFHISLVCVAAAVLFPLAVVVILIGDCGA